MTTRRSAALISSQPPISNRVRPQPMQKPDSGSMTQSFTQGVSISWLTMAFIWEMISPPGKQPNTDAPETGAKPSIPERQDAVFDLEAFQP